MLSVVLGTASVMMVRLSSPVFIGDGPHYHIDNKVINSSFL